MSETQQPDVIVPASVTATETTPLLGDNGVKPTDETRVEITTEPMTETEDPKKVEPSTLVQVTADSNEEFRPAVECNETAVCVDVSESTENETTLDESIGTVRCCAVYGGPCGLWNTSTVYVSGSLLLLPLHCLSLVLPIATGYMGATYMDKCPMSVPTPLLLFMMGLLGTIIILCRMGIVLAKRFIPPNDCEHPKSVIILGCVVVLLFYCTELLCFFRASPSFDSSATNYCDETFYNFTYYANFGFLGFVVAGILQYFPRFITMCNCRRRDESVQVQGS